MQGIQGALWVGCLVLGQAADPPSVAPSNEKTTDSRSSAPGDPSGTADPLTDDDRLPSRRPAWIHPPPATGTGSPASDATRLRWQPEPPPPDDAPPRRKKKKKKKDWKIGYDDGLFIKSPDRSFKLELTGQLQLRATGNRRVEDDGDQDFRSTVEFRRAKLKASGHIFGSWLDYSVSVGRDRHDGQGELQSAWGRVQITKDLSLRIGRFRPPLLREESVSTKRQLAAERSVIATAFRQDRTGAAELVYQNKKFRFRGAFFQFTDDLFEDEAWFVSARAEALLKGKWKRLRDFTSFPGKKPVVAVGAGILFGIEDRDDAVATDTKLLRWTVDLSVELGGANAFAAIIGNHIDDEGLPSIDQYGVVVQGGFFLVKGLELFTRYEHGDAGSAAPNLQTITGGFNAYFNEHRVKLTMDVGYGLNEVTDFWSSSATGWRTDDAGQNGQIVVRGQLQVLF